MSNNRSSAEALKNELKVLDILNHIYDDGTEEILGKIATSIRVICKDTNRCKSLLLQNDLKDKIKFCTYSGLKINHNNLLSSFPLCQIQASNTRASYLPLLESDKEIGGIMYISNFNKWWNQEVIKDNKKECFSRKDLVENVCEKEGGAHYDVKLPNKYKELFYNNSLGTYFIKNNLLSNSLQNSTLDNKAHLATIRHISYELGNALKAISEW